MPASNKLSLDVAIESGDWPVAEVENWLAVSLDAAAQASIYNLARGEVSIVLVDDAAMQTINATHRQQYKPTNVLSFPALEPDQLAKLDGSRPFLLGDLVFASETLKKEAKAGDLTLQDHMSHLIVHGFLHLLGYDHEINEQAEAMEALETRILDGLGIADPYAR